MRRLWCVGWFVLLSGNRAGGEPATGDDSLVQQGKAQPTCKLEPQCNTRADMSACSLISFTLQDTQRANVTSSGLGVAGSIAGNELLLLNSSGISVPLNGNQLQSLLTLPQVVQSLQSQVQNLTTQNQNLTAQVQALQQQLTTQTQALQAQVTQEATVRSADDEFLRTNLSALAAVTPAGAKALANDAALLCFARATCSVGCPLSASPVTNTLLREFVQGSQTITFPCSITLNVLIVGGGGSGGDGGTDGEGSRVWYHGGGGGGAGGVGFGSLTFTQNTPYTISVGNGGIPWEARATPGSPSSIKGGVINETAFGGGRGAGFLMEALSGGSGGGGSYLHPSFNSTIPGGNGNRGSGSLTYLGNGGGLANDTVGSSAQSFIGGGGGGGATQPGGQVVNGTTQGGAGGDGYTWPFNQKVYGGGGGGGSGPGAASTTVTGGIGGGGRGGVRYAAAGAGVPGTGGGGGGGGDSLLIATVLGGAGGRGVVILGYRFA